MQFAELLANSHVLSCIHFKAKVMWLGKHFRGETPIPGHAWLSDWSEQASLGKTVACPKWPCWSNGACWCHEHWHHTNCCVLQVNSPRVSPSVALQTNQFMRLCTSAARFRSTSFSLTDQDYTFKPKPLSDLSGSRACLIVCWSMGIFAPASLVPGDLFIGRCRVPWNIGITWIAASSRSNHLRCRHFLLWEQRAESKLDIPEDCIRCMVQYEYS